MPRKIQCYVILRKKDNRKLFAALPSTSSCDQTKIKARKQLSHMYNVDVLSPRVFKQLKNKFTNDRAPLFMGTVSWGGSESTPTFMGKFG